MKKLIMILMMGMMMFPMMADAKVYKGTKMDQPTHFPTKTPSLYNIGVYVDEESGDLYITPYSDITGLNITVTGNGVTYLNTTVSLSSGQSYTDCLNYLGVGTYILTLSTIDGIIDQYEITVEDD